MPSHTFLLGHVSFPIPTSSLVHELVTLAWVVTRILLIKTVSDTDPQVESAQFAGRHGSLDQGAIEELLNFSFLTVVQAKSIGWLTVVC
jgi:hypothetical protein